VTPHLTRPVVVIPEFYPLTVTPHLTRPVTAAVVDQVSLQIAPQGFLMDMVDHPAQPHTVLTCFLDHPNQPDSAVADPPVAYLDLSDYVIHLLYRENHRRSLQACSTASNLPLAEAHQKVHLRIRAGALHLANSHTFHQLVVLRHDIAAL